MTTLMSSAKEQGRNTFLILMEEHLHT